MDIKNFLKGAALSIILSLWQGTSGYAGKYSEAWEHTKIEVKNFDEQTAMASQNEYVQEVLKTIKKYEKKLTDLKGDEAQIPYIHETVHHLIAALNAFKDDMQTLKGDHLKKAKKNVETIKQALEVLTTLEATHNIVVRDNIKIIHHDDQLVTKDQLINDEVKKEASTKIDKDKNRITPAEDKSKDYVNK